MPLYDYRCQECGDVEEHFVPSDTNQLPCLRCEGTALRIYLSLAKPLWSALAMGDSASPEAVDKFEKMHKQQAAKESKALEDHGDYGPRPGA